MAENTKIEWCDHTFNPWIGCTKVGPPCDYCYAEALSDRYGWVEWGPHGERKRTSEANWKKPLQWARAARAAGIRQSVFCASLADWLDKKAPQHWRVDLYEREIRPTPELYWLLLTKRIQNYQRLKPWAGDAPSNVWLGISCGDQAEYDRDWPKLAGIPAAVRFISYEPALGPLRLLSRLGPSALPDWIICGGESGPKARTMEPAWAELLLQECAALGVAFFMKQMTGKKPIPDHLMLRQFPTPRPLEAAA
jgi:protein gp37